MNFPYVEVSPAAYEEETSAEALNEVHILKRDIALNNIPHDPERQKILKIEKNYLFSEYQQLTLFTQIGPS